MHVDNGYSDIMG